MAETFRVLVADDERLIANNIAKNIERVNPAFHVVGIAQDGAEALAQVERLLPHVVFSDIKMPVIDGLALFATLAETHPEIKKVIISGYDDFALVREALQNKAFDYLLKPVNREELRAVLEQLANQLNSEKGMLSPEKQESVEKIVSAVQTYLKDHYAQPIDFSAIACQYGFSGSYLSRIFHEKTGVTPQKFLIQHRIACAKRLLADTKLSVQEVGAHVGYPDPFHFSKVFKQNVCLSPAQFRKSSADFHG
jgi:two-component system, response regulator YesN